jgi:hypothetical protein
MLLKIDENETTGGGKGVLGRSGNSIFLLYLS